MAKVMPLTKFTRAMQSVYGPFSNMTVAAAEHWAPPPMAEGHRGRYLWTDAFAVCNFLTLYQQSREEKHLILAKRLVATVHDILGRTRDLSSRLPGATDTAPLNGGLRIGKHADEDDPNGDGDGQYFHYLVKWMFALNRMSEVTSERSYNDQAISLARSITPKFMVNWESVRPRMFWKLSINLDRPMVHSEGYSDPFDGYITYKLLQKTAGNSQTLAEEIKALKKIVDSKWQRCSSSDPLDLGMTLWLLHWIQYEEQWAREMLIKAVECVRKLNDSGYFTTKPLNRRLAFREFGTALGCASLAEDVGNQEDLRSIKDDIISIWEGTDLVPEASSDIKGRMAELIPITAVMYASAVMPGCMMKATP